MPVPFEGGCRCGQIRYRCAVEPAIMVHCFCRDCQYASGGACSTVVVVPSDGLTVDGAPTAYELEVESGARVARLFCPRCGTPLFAKGSRSPDLLVIKAATLDDPSWLPPAVQIWTQSAPPWACIAEGLPTFARNLGEG